MPMAVAQSYCTEAARAAALASHSAASLAAAAGFREAARLLRSSEALARARPEARSPATGNGAEGDDVKVKKKRSNKKTMDKKAAMEGVIVSPELLPAAVGVHEAAPASASTPILSQLAVVPAAGKATRVLVARTSRERSPHGARAPTPASSSASISHVPVSAFAGTAAFAEGQAVLLVDLVSRADLVGKSGVVKFFDSASSRYAVCIDASGETVRVLEGNLRASIFVPGGGLG